MTNFPVPSEQYLAAQLTQARQGVAAANRQKTEYVVDSTGVCQAIVGNVAAEPNGTVTGLAGWGVAVKAYGGGWVALASTPELVTALPTPATDGQECYYLADATNGVVWHLRYRAGSASTHKWEFVGGAPVSRGPEGSSTLIAKEEKVLASGPTVTVPLSGEYLVALQLRATLEEAALVGTVGKVRKNGTPIAGVGLFTFTAATNFASVRATNEGTYALTAADVLTVGCEIEQAVKVTFNGGRLAIVPIRVG